jgi:ribA/ribD-fused uncharacterized protein
MDYNNSVKLTQPPSEVVWNGKTHPISWKPRPNGGFWVDNWFSNMQVCEKPIYQRGLAFTSTEAAYQAAKFNDPNKIKAIQDAPYPQRTKTMIRDWPVETADWHNFRLSVMWNLCCQKWIQPKHKEILLSHQEEIVEFNNWNDVWYGVAITNEGEVKGGQNFLGRIIMEVRNQIEQGVEFKQPAWLIAPPKPLEPQLTLF